MAVRARFELADPVSRVGPLAGDWFQPTHPSHHREVTLILYDIKIYFIK